MTGWRFFRVITALFVAYIGVIAIIVDSWEFGIFLFILAYYIGVPNYGSDYSRKVHRAEFEKWIKNKYDKRESVIPKSVKEHKWGLYSTNNKYLVDSVTLHDTVFDFNDNLNSDKFALLIISDNPKEIDLNQIDYLNAEKIGITIVESYPSQHYTYHDRFTDLFGNTEISIRFVPHNQSKERIIHDSYCIYGSACPYE